MTRGVSRKLPTQLPARFTRGFAWKVDRRCKSVREVAGSLWELWQDLGGVEGLSVQELILCERVVFIQRKLLAHESAVLSGRDPTMTPGEHANAINTLVGLLKALGLKRRSKPEMTLDGYVVASSGGAQ